MSIFDELPTTEQGLITFMAYAEKQIKALEKDQHRLIKMLEECRRRKDKLNEQIRN